MNERSGKLVYKSPKLVKIDLRPEEVGPSHCKMASAAGPIAPSCNVLILSCSSIGS